MKRYDVITLLDFGDKRLSTKIGSFLETRRSGCYKLDLDYVPSDSEDDTDMLCFEVDAEEAMQQTHPVVG